VRVIGGATVPAITISNGKGRAAGRRLPLPGGTSTARALQEALRSLPADNAAWWAPALFAGGWVEDDGKRIERPKDYRLAALWEGAVAVVVDADNLAHAEWTPSAWESAMESIVTADVPGSIAELTPHGLRITFPLDRATLDVTAWKRAAEGACVLVARYLREAGLQAEVDRPASTDAAHFYWAPRANVPYENPDGSIRYESRADEVYLVRDRAWTIEELAGYAPTAAADQPRAWEPLPDAVLPPMRHGTLKRRIASLSAKGYRGETLADMAMTINARHCKPPKPESEVRDLCAYYERKDGGNGHKPSLSRDEDTASPIHHPSDVGNALRLVDRHGDDMRHVPGWGLVCWDGRRWARDDTRQGVRYATACVRAIYAEAEDEPDPSRRIALAKHARASEAAARIAAMIELAKADARIQARPEDFDRDPMLLNVANGTVDLAKGTIRAHDRRDLITKLSQVVADGAATCPRFERFLRDVFEDNEELIGYVRRAAGYSMTGHTREHALFLCHGTGRNGKSTLLEVLKAVSGEYGYQAPQNFLLEQRHSGGPRDGVAQLHGKRIVAAVEPDRGKRLNVALVKWVTGGDELTGSFLYRDAFSFKPSHSPWLAANHKPTIDEQTAAIWERVHLIPFLVSFVGREDKTLLEELRKELPGILNWCIRGALEWQERGLDPPAEVRAATRAYREESDHLGPFLEARCSFAPDAMVTAKDFRAAYLEWCCASDEQPLSTRDVAERLRSEFGCVPGKGSPRAWRGVRLLAAGEPPQTSIGGTE
jgi:putative DNA primase/helicase